ncbi:MAG: peptidoglycan DD-metalloendopeptidase family protein [Leptospiraceae bacterium]|nr:peptidoglycan DD-metalloendopeptidase family protein [Leptospiraceae bacterium]MCP5496182.1 peptidoglycan DD-metalloendopeptidase family protein [Leptospiraceae bacterium]
MIKRKLSQKTKFGHELLKTKNFSLIYLDSGNLHYSYKKDRTLIFGDIDLSKKRFKIIPLFLLASIFTIYIGFIPESKAAMNGVIENREYEENSERDKYAKKADKKYLEETEKMKMKYLSSQSKRSEKLRIIHYKVKPYESILDISKKFNLSIESILASSNLKDGNLQPGTILNIPNKQGLLYKFKKGDTLAKVASFYQVSIQDVVGENELTDVDVFLPGQKIFLPGASIPESPIVWYPPVSSRRITSGFGWRTFPTPKFHDALDLRANYDIVRAARTGVVIFSGWMGGYGNTVIIDHTKGFKTLYAHNSKLKVRAGDYVRANKAIAVSGCTGYCFGAHLHFEVIKNGKTVNPKKYVGGLR